MITIKYKSVIIDGQDKTGKTETVSRELGLRLVNQGYAEISEELAQPALSGTMAAPLSQQGSINPEDLPFDSPLYLDAAEIHGEDGPVKDRLSAAVENLSKNVAEPPSDKSKKKRNK
jgi:hypothetical protein